MYILDTGSFVNLELRDPGWGESKSNVIWRWMMALSNVMAQQYRYTQLPCRHPRPISIALSLSLRPSIHSDCCTMEYPTYPYCIGTKWNLSKKHPTVPVTCLLSRNFIHLMFQISPIKYFNLSTPHSQLEPIPTSTQYQFIRKSPNNIHPHRIPTYIYTLS